MMQEADADGQDAERRAAPAVSAAGGLGCRTSGESLTKCISFANISY